MTGSLIEVIKSANEAEALRMIEAGAAIDERDEHQWTVLCWAAANGSLPLVEQLLCRGADPFAAGTDLRTPYKIALAASHRDVVERLARAEQERGGDQHGVSSRQGELRPYCRAYTIADLRRFPGWTEPASADRPGDDDVVFLHRDLTVTKMIWAGEDVIYDRITPDWEQYCRAALAFTPPGDLDLIRAR